MLFNLGPRRRELNSVSFSPTPTLRNLDRHARVELVVPAAATSSSNAIACGAAMVLCEAIQKTGYDWKADGPNIASALLAIMQNTGVTVFDPATEHSYQRPDLTGALDYVYMRDGATVD